MSAPAIRVEGLSKAYRIGVKEEMPDSLVGAALSFAKRPLAGLRDLRRLDAYSSADDDADDVVWALKDVSFDVQEGEVVGVIGRNGAGKSTLLKILSRITEPTRGRAVIRGRVSSLLEVGTGFHPELTGRENVYMNGTILGMTKREIDRKFDEIVDFSGVEKFLDTPVKRYSSGMSVRLAFAVAAHLEPEILIVDEVLAVGDAEFQAKCLGKMKDVASHGRTVLFVSHNMGAVQQLCSRGILIRHGLLACEGTAATVVYEYINSLSRSGSNVFAADNPNRSGSGKIQFTDVRIFNQEGMRTNDLISGHPARFAFEFRRVEDVSDAQLTFTIFNDLGVAVTNISNSLNAFRIDVSSIMSVVCCEIDAMPLPLGRYRVAASLSSGGEQQDLIPNVLTFEVVSSCYYATSLAPDRRWCAVMVPHRWRQESLEPESHSEMPYGKMGQESRA